MPSIMERKILVPQIHWKGQLCGTELSQSKDNVVVKSPQTKIILYHIITGLVLFFLPHMYLIMLRL